jgi:GNAT superfamily N-acetyltransferase
MTGLVVRKPAPSDRAGWDHLYAGYAAFYRVDQTPAMRDTVWSWIMTGKIEARVAEGADGLIGLAHFRAFRRPLSASVGGFLDDLFVDPAARGSGAAQALIDAVAAHGRAQGWSVIRWITADDNYRARSAYDRVADRTAWVTYDIKL